MLKPAPSQSETTANNTTTSTAPSPTNSTKASLEAKFRQRRIRNRNDLVEKHCLRWIHALSAVRSFRCTASCNGQFCIQPECPCNSARYLYIHKSSTAWGRMHSSFNQINAIHWIMAALYYATTGRSPSPKRTKLCTSLLAPLVTAGDSTTESSHRMLDDPCSAIFTKVKALQTNDTDAFVDLPENRLAMSAVCAEILANCRFWSDHRSVNALYLQTLREYARKLYATHLRSHLRALQEPIKKHGLQDLRVVPNSGSAHSGLLSQTDVLPAPVGWDWSIHSAQIAYAIGLRVLALAIQPYVEARLTKSLDRCKRAASKGSRKAHCDVVPLPVRSLRSFVQQYLQILKTTADERPAILGSRCLNVRFRFSHVNNTCWNSVFILML